MIEIYFKRDVISTGKINKEVTKNTFGGFLLEDKKNKKQGAVVFCPKSIYWRLKPHLKR